MTNGIGVEQFDGCELLSRTSGLLLEPSFQIVCGSARERHNGAGRLFEVIVEKCRDADGLLEQLVEFELGLRAEAAKSELVNVFQQSEAFPSLDADHDAGLCFGVWRRLSDE